MIYFIECSGRVKVGFSLDPKARVRKIEADAPFPCALIGVIAGDRQTEDSIHSRWSHLRCHGEWFAASSEFLKWIEENTEEQQRRVNVDRGKSKLCGVQVRRGDLTRIAAAVGVTRGAVSQWRKIPAEYCHAVSDITGHPVWVLRPDIFGAMQGGVQ
jgi:hypothetical protein